MVKYISLIVVCFAVWFLWPVYEFFAHKGKVAFPPFYQFTSIPTDKPNSQRVGDQRYQAAGKRVLELAHIHQNNINAPAISVAVAVNQKLVWAGASGWADIENQVPATTQTQFRIGSTSKAVTSIGLARAVDQKLIDVDMPISAYMPDVPNHDWLDITSRQLASHTAGLPHYKENSDFLGAYRTMSLSTTYEDVYEALSVFDGSEMLYEPGTVYSYSSLGTVLLSAVMEAAVDTPYLQWMKQSVFTPLGLKATTAEYDNPTPERLAKFYWNDQGRTNEVREWRAVDLSHRLAGGGFISTSSELVKLGSAFLDNNFVSAETRQQFWTAQALPNGEMPPHNYAIGWRDITLDLGEGIGLVQILNHGGVSRGAQSWLMVLPAYDMAVAVNINSNTEIFADFSRISLDVAREFIKVKENREKARENS